MRCAGKNKSTCLIKKTFWESCPWSTNIRNSIDNLWPRPSDINTWSLVFLICKSEIKHTLQECFQDWLPCVVHNVFSMASGRGSPSGLRIIRCFVNPFSKVTRFCFESWSCYWPLSISKEVVPHPNTPLSFGTHRMLTIATILDIPQTSPHGVMRVLRLRDRPCLWLFC